MSLATVIFLKILFLFQPVQEDNVPASIYKFKERAVNGDGSVIDFAKFEGKMILIVNTASECIYTSQFMELQKMYRQYFDSLVIVGFPTNDFGQDPAPDNEIAAFCRKNYKITFPMAAKIFVKGKDKAVIYQWLTQKRHNHVASSEISWNFQKYLIDSHGKLVAVFEPGVSPYDTTSGVITWLEPRYAAHRRPLRDR